MKKLFMIGLVLLFMRGVVTIVAKLDDGSKKKLIAIIKKRDETERVAR